MLPNPEALARQSEHEVNVDVGKARIPCRKDGAADLCRPMDSTETGQLLGDEALSSEANAIEPTLSHRLELGGVYGAGVRFARNLATLDWRMR